MFLTATYRTREIARSGGVAFCRETSPKKSAAISQILICGAPHFLSIICVNLRNLDQFSEP